MMKKYNKPEIVTLALDMVDVIETSGGEVAKVALEAALTAEGKAAEAITVIESQITSMSETWSW